MEFTIGKNQVAKHVTSIQELNLSVDDLNKINE